MKFKVKTGTGKENAILTVTNLLDLLIGASIKKEKKDIEALATELTAFLQRNASMGDTPISHLIFLSFSLGYYYRVFLEKNNVEVEGEEENNENISNEVPGI